MSELDERFYPVTDERDWEPLRLALHPCLIDGWMFMEKHTDGLCVYKHRTTRESFVCGAWWDEEVVT